MGSAEEAELMRRDREWREDIVRWMRKIEESLNEVKTNQITCSAYHKPVTQHLEKDMAEIKELVTGGNDPEKGLPARISALEKSAERQSKLYWMLVGTGLTSLASIVIAVGAWLVKNAR